MKILIILLSMGPFIMTGIVSGGNPATSETFETGRGPLKVTFYGHASLLLQWEGHNIYVDPWGKMADYSNEPVADLILITHEHTDHYDPQVIGMLSGAGTQVILNAATYKLFGKGKVLGNGDDLTWNGIRITAVPAYNTTPDRTMYHPKDRDNGYLLRIGDFTLYIAGDTENTPEMKSLKQVDVALLPMNQPYTMTPEQVADAASAFRPQVLIPYHTTEAGVMKLKSMKSTLRETELRTPVLN